MSRAFTLSFAVNRKRSWKSHIFFLSLSCLFLSMYPKLSKVSVMIPSSKSCQGFLLFFVCFQNGSFGVFVIH